MYQSPNQGAQPLPEDDPVMAAELAASGIKSQSAPAPASATGKKAYSSRKARDFMDDQSEEEANYAVTENNNN